MKRTDTLKEEKSNALQDFPGVAIDTADKEKTNPELIKERTETLNNNPRNDYPEDE